MTAFITFFKPIHEAIPRADQSDAMVLVAVQRLKAEVAFVKGQSELAETAHAG